MLNSQEDCNNELIEVHLNIAEIYFSFRHVYELWPPNAVKSFKKTLLYFCDISIYCHFL